MKRTIHQPARKPSLTSRTRPLRRLRSTASRLRRAAAPPPASPSRAPIPGAPASHRSSAGSTRPRRGLGGLQLARNLSSLADGSHKFEVRAVDQAGNIDATPASSTWTVDTTAPTTAIDSGPPALERDRPPPSFTFSRRPTAAARAWPRFQCRLDSSEAAAWATCNSPSPMPRSLTAATIRGPVDRPGRQHRSDAGELQLGGRHRRAEHLDRLRSGSAHEQELAASFAFSGTDAGGSGVATSSAGSTRARPPHWAACTSPATYSGARRRLPHLRSPRGRPGREHRRDPGELRPGPSTPPRRSCPSTPGPRASPTIRPRPLPSAPRPVRTSNARSTPGPRPSAPARAPAPTRPPRRWPMAPTPSVCGRRTPR